MIARRVNVWLVLLAVCASGSASAPAGAGAGKKAAGEPPARAKPPSVRKVTASGAAATRPATTRPVRVRRIRYRPPRRGAPITREASAARGAEDPLPNVMVLAPEHTGLTTRAQPTFAWHQDRSARTKLILTLTNEKTFDTLMALKLRKEASAGVHSLELADVGLALDANVDYKWSVGIITGREHASGDPYSAAHVMRVAAPAELARRLSGADGLQRVLILAEEGIWYDALGELCGLVRAFPGDGSLRELRTRFLRDAGVLGQGSRSGGSASRGGPGRAGPATRPAGPPQTQPARRTGGKAPTTKPAPRRTAATRPARMLAMRYRPPKRGAPVTRETSASRRSDVALPNVFVLAPKHTGLTRRAHPVLAWYQDKPARATFVLTLTKADELDTVLELKVMKDAPAGHHRFELARVFVRPYPEDGRADRPGCPARRCRQAPTRRDPRRGGRLVRRPG